MTDTRKTQEVKAYIPIPDKADQEVGLMRVTMVVRGGEIFSRIEISDVFPDGEYTITMPVIGSHRRGGLRE